MASLPQVEARLNQLLTDHTALKSVVQSIMDGTLSFSELSSPTRLEALDSIYPRILNNGRYWRTIKLSSNTDYAAFQVGDIIRDIDTTNNVSYVGVVLNASLTLPADFNNTAKIELYNQDSPAI